MNDEEFKKLQEHWDEIIEKEDRLLQNAYRRDRNHHILSLDKMYNNKFELYTFVPSTEKNPEKVLLQKERMEELYLAISKLNDDEIELITHIFFYEKKQTELAEKYGCSNAAVSKKKKKILGKLRSLMEFLNQ